MIVQPLQCLIKENDDFTVTAYQSVFYLCRTILYTKWKARINIEESYRNINEKRRDVYKTAMRFIIQSIVLVVISCTMMGTDSYLDRLYAFHQNYPEFSTEEEVKGIYEVLKNAPNFESKLMQIENMTDLINAGCSMNMVISVEPSEPDTAKSMLEICDNEVMAMKMECDEHYDLMKYCKDKDDFMMDYITERNLNENLSGGVASISPN